MYLGLGVRGRDSFAQHDQTLLDSPVVHITCGAGCTAAIARTGNLYFVGNIGIDQYDRFKQFQIPQNQKTKHITMGYHTFIIVTSTCLLFSNILAIGKVYAGGFQNNRTLEEVVLSPMMTHGFCGYDMAAFYNGHGLFAGNKSSERVKQDVDGRSIKLLECHLTGTVHYVTHDDNLYNKRINTNGDFLSTEGGQDRFVKDQVPKLSVSETIVSIATGYNFMVMVRVNVHCDNMLGYWTKEEKTKAAFTLEI